MLTQGLPVKAPDQTLVKRAWTHVSDLGSLLTRPQSTGTGWSTGAD